MTEYKVIDVSYAQGAIDWEKVKGNIDAVIIRCGYGSDIAAQDDDFYLYNVTEAERLGIPYAVYLYSYAQNKAMAQSEARHVIRLLKGRKPWAVYYDVEESGLGPVSVPNADAFCSMITSAGYRAGVYTFESWYNTYMQGYTRYPLWIAKVSTHPPVIGASFEGWQYTFSASVPGISTAVDCSRFYVKLWDVEKPAEPVKTPQKAVQRAPRITYGIQTLNHGIIDDTGNGGVIECENDGITGVKIAVTSGTVEYRVHAGGRWLPVVTGANWNDYNNGWAGDGVNLIDAIQIYYHSPGTPYYEAVYAVRSADNSRFYAWVHDTDFEDNDGSGTAGVFGKPFTALKVKLKKV